MEYAWSLTILLIFSYRVFRGCWVHKNKMKIMKEAFEITEKQKGILNGKDGGKMYESLVQYYWDYDKMLHHFWIWDINKMRSK